MKGTWVALLGSFVFVAEAGDSSGEKEVRPTDAYRRIQHDKPSLVFKENGRIIQQDALGRLQPHKQQYVVKGGAVYHADYAGRIQHDKPSFKVQKNGRIIQRDRYGNPQYHKPQFVIKDSTVYESDRTGRAKKPAYKIEE